MESQVRIFPDSTGKPVRLLQVNTSQGAVDQEVVSLGDEAGNLLPVAALMNAFGALRVAPPVTVLDTKFLVDKQPLFWDEQLTGTGTSTYDPVHSQISLAVAVNNDKVVRQTKLIVNHQLGKGHVCMFTGLFKPETNVQKRVGFFDGTNGIFLSVTGTTIAMNIMSGGVVTETVQQSAWNQDKLDGTGTSQITLDLTAVQIFVMDFQWLGVGRVRVGFIINGRVIYAHAFDHANVSGQITTYMKTPNLPLRYEILSLGSAGSMVQICSTAISEGNSDPQGLTYSVDMPVASPFATPATGKGAVMAVRLQPGSPATVKPVDLEFFLTSAGNNSLRWELWLNPVVAGAALAFAAVPNTNIELALGIPTNLCTGGFLMDSGFVSSTSRVASPLLDATRWLGVALDGTRDILVLSVENIAGQPGVLAQMGLREIT